MSSLCGFSLRVLSCYAFSSSRSPCVVRGWARAGRVAPGWVPAAPVCRGWVPVAPVRFSVVAPLTTLRMNPSKTTPPRYI